MGKTYNISSSSDMKRFERDLRSHVQNLAVNALMTKEIDVTCPYCNRQIQAHSGNNICPYCRRIVTLKLDIHL